MTTDNEMFENQINDNMNEDQETAETNNTTKIVAIVAVILLLISIVWNVFFIVKQKQIKSEVAKKQDKIEQLQRESLMYEDKIEELSLTLDDAHQNITDKDLLINRLNEENATLQQIKTQVAEIQKITKGLDLTNDQLQSLQAKINKTINLKQMENNKLKANLNKQTEN